MTTLAERGGIALVVIDVQNAVVAQAHRRDQVVGVIRGLVDRARSGAVPVIWVRHEDPEMEVGTWGWQLVAELVPDPGEPIIAKRYRSSFEETELDRTLAGLAVGHLILCGAQTEYCVRHTLHAALERGYDVTLVGDGHTTWDADWVGTAVPAAAVIASLNLSCWDYQLPGRRCTTAPADAAI